MRGLQRSERLSSCTRSQAYENLDEPEAQGQEFVSTRRTLTSKGDAKRPDIRARFVGRVFMERTFAIASPLESLRYILSQFFSRRRAWTYHVHVSIPRFEESLYIRLPTGDSKAHVGKWLRTLYGT